MRSQLRHLFCILLLFTLFATPFTLIAKDGVPDPEASLNDAWLSMQIDPFGHAKVALGVPLRVTNREQLKQSLSQSLNFPIHFNPPVTAAAVDEDEEFDDDTPDEAHTNRYWMTVSGESPSAFTNTGMKAWCRINLEPLLATLKAEKIEHFKIWVVFENPNYDVNIVGAERLSFGGRTYLNYYKNDIDVGSPALPVIAFSKGYSASELFTKLLPFFLFLLIPPLWIMARSLSAPKYVDRPAELWGKHFRFLHRLVHSLWLVWLPVYSLCGLTDVISFMLGHERRGLAQFIIILFYFVPLIVTMFLCHLASARIYRYVRAVEWSPRAVVRRAILLNVFMIMPLFTLVLIVNTLGKNVRQAALYAVVGFVVWLLLNQKVTKAWGSKLHALTSGDLRDRIFELSQKAGVLLKQIYVLPDDRAQLSNAFARSDNSVMISNSLIRNLSKREVDAIMAHEIGHLKEKHPHASNTITLVVMIIANMIAMTLHKVISSEVSFAVSFSGALTVASIVLFFVSRRNERKADAIGISLTNDPEAFISGFAKLLRLNLTPLHSGGWGESLETHPRSMRRLTDIASAQGISSERLQELISDTPTSVENKYTMVGNDEGEAVIFSSDFKRKYRTRFALALFGLLVLAPIPFAWMLDGGEFGLRTLVTGFVGLFFSFGLYEVLRNKLHCSGQDSFSPQLRAKLEKRGLVEIAQHGVLVGLSPAAQSRKYEEYQFWDIGLLWLTNDKLYYVGEQTEFALNRKQVKDVYVGNSNPEWLPDRNLYLTWRPAAKSENETVYFVAVGENSLLTARRVIGSLQEQLKSWLNASGDFPATPANLASIAEPKFPAITSAPTITSFHAGPILKAGTRIAILAMMVGFAIGLSFFSLAYLGSVAFLLVLLDELPKLSKQQKHSAASLSDKSRDVPYRQGSWIEGETTTIEIVE